MRATGTAAAGRQRRSALELALGRAAYRLVDLGDGALDGGVIQLIFQVFDWPPLDRGFKRVVLDILGGDAHGGLECVGRLPLHGDGRDVVAGIARVDRKSTRLN